MRGPVDSGEPETEQVSRLLVAWSEGDEEALDRLVPIVYRELRRLAGRYMRNEREGHTLQATALVHEAYARLIDYRRMKWQSRAHFFAVAAQLMRRILVDHARRYGAKRGGGMRRIALDEAPTMGAATSGDPDLIALDDAMIALGRLDPRKVQVVELRYFGGLSVEDTAEVLKVSTVTVKRDWRAAKTWLFREITGASDHGRTTLDAS